MFAGAAGSHATSVISLNSRHSLRQLSPPSTLRNRFPYFVPASTRFGSAALVPIAHRQELGCTGNGAFSQEAPRSFDLSNSEVVPGVPSPMPMNSSFLLLGFRA